MTLSQVPVSLSAPAPRPDPVPDLGAELAALLRAGCTVAFTPRDASSYGVMVADVIVTPPASFDLVPGDELNAVRLGEVPTRPIVMRLHLIGQVSVLVDWLRDARRLVTRKPV